MTMSVVASFLDNDLGDTCKSMKEALLDKHPPAQPSHQAAVIFSDTLSNFHPICILFDTITPELIKSSAMKTNGSSVPSGLDAATWK